MTKTLKIKVGILIASMVSLTNISAVALAAGDRPKTASNVEKATSNLVSATNQYKASVAALIPMYENALKAATATLEQRKTLYEQGVISKRDLEAGEQAVKQAQAQLDQSRKQITEADQLVAEVKAELELARIKPAPSISNKVGGYAATSAILRSTGSGGWSIANASKVQGFFSTSFGRQLPVSAFGQTATHDRMRFDHRNSMDVAVHPDSAEGKALISYLRSNGIPFLAFRSAVAGAATGAHIHVGYPSHKF
jgi:hypothetical protein